MDGETSVSWMLDSFSMALACPVLRCRCERLLRLESLLEELTFDDRLESDLVR